MISGITAGSAARARAPRPAAGCRRSFRPAESGLPRACRPARGAADDLGPARDHARLDEAEAAERGAADLRHQLGDRLGRARRAAARRAWPWRLFGASVVAFHVPRPCHSAPMDDSVSPRAAGLVRRPRPDAAVAAPPGAAHGPIPIASGCRKSCCSRPPPRAVAPYFASSSRAGRRSSRSPRAARRTSWPSGQGSATTRAPAISSLAPARLRGAAGFPTARTAARAARDRRLHRRRDRRDRLRPSRGGDRRQRRAGGRAAVRDRRAAAGRAQGDPRGGRTDHAGRARRRLRPGDDGPRRDDLHPAQSQMPAVPAVGLCAARAQGRQAELPVKAAKKASRFEPAPRSGSSAAARSGWSAAREGHARRHARAARRRLERSRRRFG